MTIDKIIMGDLNADLQRGRHDATFVRNLASELSLQQVQHGSTHFKRKCGTWIDAIFVDDNDTIINGRNIPANFHSSHNLIDVTIKFNSVVPKDTNFIYRDYKNIASEDLVAPEKIVAPKKGRLPWIGAELVQLLRRPDTLHRRYKWTGKIALYEEFITLRKQIDEQTDLAKTSYLQAKLSDALSDGNIWKELRGQGLLPKHTEDLNGFTPESLTVTLLGFQSLREMTVSYVAELSPWVIPRVLPLNP